MPTLFQRITISSEDYEKIPIHLVQSCMSEVARGSMTINQASDVMGLTLDESVSFTSVLTSAQTASDGIAFSNRVFNYLVLAEIGVLDYQNESNFWQMVYDEGAK